MKYIFCTKNTGISGNILKYLLISNICYKNDFQFIFLCNDDTKKILLKFKIPIKTTFININKDHKHLFNSKSRFNIGPGYDLKYKLFIYKNYIKNNFDIELSEIDYVNGGVDTLNINFKKCLISDFYDSIQNYNNFDNYIKFDVDIPRLEDQIVINLKSSSEKYFELEVEMWSLILKEFLKHYDNRKIKVVSGNNKLKNVISERFDIRCNRGKVEKKFSENLNDVVYRGTISDVFKDVLESSSSTFYDFKNIVEKYPIDFKEYHKKSPLFNFNKPEKFNILVNLIKCRIKP